ncbi:MAG: hypothetical protein J5789_06785 [Oscillospiraceae bacterium]|nr:hypothetical protein [Oscillospiraceae bacterium]
MSASASKKKRKELEDQGLSAKDIAAKKAHDKKSKTTKTVVVAALAVIICIAAVFAVIKLVNQPDYDTSAPVLSVGTEKITVPVYNYLYNNSAVNFCNTYSSFIKAGTPFAEQSSIFGEGTMEDYMKQSANNSIKEFLNVVAKARENNYYTLTEDDKTTIQENLKALETEAASYGFSSVDKYLKARYGDGCDQDNYEDYLELVALYSGCAQKLSDEFKPTAEELQNAYAEDPSVYDLVSFTYTTSSAKSTPVESTDNADDQETDSSEPTQVPTTYTDEAKAEAREKAEGYAAEMPEDAIDLTGTKSDAISRTTEEIAEWLFDASRKEGDVKVFASNEQEIYFYAVRFNSRDTNDYRLAKANILTITKDKEEEKKEETSTDKKDQAIQDESQVDAGKDEEEKKEEKTAEQKRTELLAAIHEGMTDEEYSKAVTDLGYTTATNNVTKSYSIQEIVDFLYDENRKAGDLFTAYESDTAYYVVRFVGLEEKTYRDQMVESNLWSKYYSDIATANELTVDEELMKHANTNLVYGSSNTTSAS